MPDRAILLRNTIRKPGRYAEFRGRTGLHVYHRFAPHRAREVDVPKDILAAWPEAVDRGLCVREFNNLRAA